MVLEEVKVEVNDFDTLKDVLRDIDAMALDVTEATTEAVLDGAAVEDHDCDAVVLEVTEATTEAVLDGAAVEDHDCNALVD